MTEQWALLWSHRQNSLHIEPIDSMLTVNRGAYRDNRAVDYIPLFIGPREVVAAAACAMRSTLADREFDMPERRAA